MIDNRLEELRAYRGINPKPDDFGHYWAAALRERMTPRQMREFCRISASCHASLKHAGEALHLSSRAHDRILKVARPLAEACDDLIWW